MSREKKGNDSLNVVSNADSTSTNCQMRDDVKSGTVRAMVSYGVKKLLEAIFD